MRAHLAEFQTTPPAQHGDANPDTHSLLFARSGRQLPRVAAGLHTRVHPRRRPPARLHPWCTSRPGGSGAPRARVRLSARACVCGDLGLEIDSRATLPSRFSPSLIAPSSDHFCFLRQTVECMTNRPVWKTHPLGSFKPFPLLSVPSLAWQMIVLRRTRRKRLEKEANVRSVPGRQEHARHPPPKITLLTL